MCLQAAYGLAEKTDLRNNSIFEIYNLIRSNGRFAKTTYSYLTVLKCRTFQGDKKWQRVMI